MKYLKKLWIIIIISAISGGAYANKEMLIEQKLAHLLNQKIAHDINRCQNHYSPRIFCDQDFFCDDFTKNPSVKRNNLYLYLNDYGQGVPNYDALKIINRSMNPKLINLLEKYPTLKFLINGDNKQNNYYPSYVENVSQSFLELKNLIFKYHERTFEDLTLIIPDPRDNNAFTCLNDQVVSIDQVTKQMTICPQFINLPLASLEYYITASILSFLDKDDNPFDYLISHWGDKKQDIAKQVRESFALEASQLCLSPTSKIQFLKELAPDSEYIDLWLRDELQTSAQSQILKKIKIQPMLNDLFNCREEVEIEASR